MKKVQSFIKKEKKFIISMCILFFGNAILYWGLKLFQSSSLSIKNSMPRTVDANWSGCSLDSSVIVYDLKVPDLWAQR